MMPPAEASVRHRPDREFAGFTGPAGRPRIAYFLQGVHLQAEIKVRDREPVAGPEPAPGDPLAVDPEPVGATEVADHHVGLDRAQAAMVPRDPDRAEPDVTPGMAADHHRSAPDDDLAVTRPDATRRIFW